MSEKKRVEDLAKLMKEYNLASIEIEGDRICLASGEDKPEPLSPEASKLLDDVAGKPVTDEDILFDPMAGLPNLDKGVQE